VDIVELFEKLNVLNQARWRSKDSGHIVRIDQRIGSKLHISVELKLCRSWISAAPIEIKDFLEAYTPYRGGR
jgi:hypothetical protein